MPMAGRKPKPQGTAINRNKPVHEWTEIPDVPYGDGPDLPDYPLARKDEDAIEGWHPMTLEWWDDIRTMPHASLWKRSDWRFAMDTALVADRLYSGDLKAAAELRNREKLLGTTIDFRRDLRIRYIEPREEKKRPDTEEEEASNVRYLDL